MNSNLAKVWIMRAGARGEDEETALKEGRAIIGFKKVENLQQSDSLEALIARLLEEDETRNKDRAATRARQLWAFHHLAQIGDIVVLPLKTHPGQIALGRVASPYEYAKIGSEFRHTRKVNWVKPDVPRSIFKQDLLYSFGALMTVCRISRNDAERRVAEVLAGKADPGFEEESTTVEHAPPVGEAADPAAALDLAQASQDEIVAYVRKRFQKHDLARLIAAVLEADGYVTSVSPPGRDGGADILAGRGLLGMDSPTMCVQVKAWESPADVKVLRELIGTVNTFKSDQGLLVCWGGFTQPLKVEARQHSFKVRLWDQADIVNAVYRTYEKLSPEIQAELPLKRIWMLVQEDVSNE